MKKHKPKWEQGVNITVSPSTHRKLKKRVAQLPKGATIRSLIDEKIELITASS